MYLLRTRQITHVFALSVAFSIVFATYCGNFIEDKLSDMIDSIKCLLTPQINFYGNYDFPYFY